jgi:hypothetical protein
MPINDPALMQALVQRELAKDQPAYSDTAARTEPQGIGAAPYAAAIGGQGADAITTMMALGRPGAKELNPMGGAGIMGAKLGMGVAAPFLMHYLQSHGHPTAAKALGYGVGAAGVIPAISNIHQMTKGQ